MKSYFQQIFHLTVHFLFLFFAVSISETWTHFCHIRFICTHLKKSNVVSKLMLSCSLNDHLPITVCIKIYNAHTEKVVDSSTELSFNAKGSKCCETLALLHSPLPAGAETSPDTSPISYNTGSAFFPELLGAKNY